jgi:hypothetical protein
MNRACNPVSFHALVNACNCGGNANPTNVFSRLKRIGVIA